MPPPLLVVEVVSPGKIQQERDYIAKRNQYEDLGISEYWIVDPQLKKVTVLSLESEHYQESSVFLGQQVITSSILPDFKLTASAVLSAQ